MARTLLSGAIIVYDGEPIRDLSLSAFLDKFIEKKPKSSWRTGGTWHGGSEIAPARKVCVHYSYQQMPFFQKLASYALLLIGIRQVDESNTRSLDTTVLLDHSTDEHSGVLCTISLVIADET